MENVDYLLKIERKNRQQQQLMFEKKLHKIDLELDSNQNELKNAIISLNQEEKTIYEIQKTNLDKFKTEILKYENIYNEIKLKAETLGNQINESEILEAKLYNQTFMLKEDYLSYNNELTLLRDQVQVHLDNLNNLEKDYPKEYKFIQEDFQLENQLNNLKSQLNNNNIDIKNMKRENNN
jgi:chromosome segregation ATPase